MSYKINYAKMINAIKLAIEKGGYDKDIANSNQFSRERTEAEIILDPLFWQALGKALGWGENAGIKSSDIENTWLPLSGWKYHAHQYFDLVLTGGDVEKFWKELLSPLDGR
jgi:hypothetical protein